MGHSIFEKTFVFLFKESAIKPTPLLHANFQIPWQTKCNQSNWWRPECFYEPESPVATPKSSQAKLPVRNIYQSYGWMCIHAGSDKSAAHVQAIAQLQIVNWTKYKIFTQITFKIFELPPPPTPHPAPLPSKLPLFPQ